MQDLGLPVCHLRRFWGSLWSRGSPAPHFRELVGGQRHLRALPAHLGKVWGTLGVSVIRSWGLAGHRSPGRGVGLWSEGANPPGSLGGRWQRIPSEDWAMALQEGGWGAYPLPSHTQILPRESPKTSRFYSTRAN